MRLYEFESKQILEKYKIETPHSRVVFAPGAPDMDITAPVMLKGAVQLDGKFIDAPIVARASQIVQFDQSGHRQKE